MAEIPKQIASGSWWVAIIGTLFIAAVAGVTMLFWLIVWAMEKMTHFMLGG